MKQQMKTEAPQEQTQPAAANKREVVDQDREAWVKARLKTAIEMALAVKNRRNVAADDVIYECALAGIINGAAIEIIRSLGLEPGYVNIQRPASQTVTSAANAIDEAVRVLMRPDPMRPWAWLGGAGDALERKLEAKEEDTLKVKAMELARYMERTFKIKPSAKIAVDLEGLIRPTLTVSTNLQAVNRYLSQKWKIRPTSLQLKDLQDRLR